MARSKQYPPSVDPGAPVEPQTPTGWGRHSFESLFEVVERPTALENERTYQLVNARRSRGGIVARQRLKGADIRVKTQFVIQSGDFLVSKRQIIHGACGIVPSQLEGAVVSNEYAVLRPKLPLTSEYLRYLPETSYFQRTCFHSSVGVDVEKMVFKLDRWFRFHMPLPPLSEQHKIAAILSCVDDAIGKTEAVIEQLDVVKKGLLGEVLTRGVPGQHREFKETDIGRIPASWLVLALADVARIERGKFSHRPRNDRRFYGGRYPFIQTGDVAACRGRLRRFTQTLNERGLAVSKLFPAGTIVMTIAANIGDTGIAEMEVAFPDSLVGIRPGVRMEARFLEYVLRTRKPQLENAAPRNAQKNINLQILGPVSIQVPPIGEQQIIADHLDSVEGQIASELDCVSQIRPVKMALVDALLSGRVRVPAPVEEAA